MKDGRLPKRQYTEEYKVEAVRLAGSVGGHEAARRLGVPVRKPDRGLLVHTDRGSQYAGGRYRALTTELGITMSMSGKANAWGNAPMESFFKTLKVERIYQVRYDTRAQARLDIVDWIEGWYNRQRLHSANGFLAPVTWERARLAA